VLFAEALIQSMHHRWPSRFGSAPVNGAVSAFGASGGLHLLLPHVPTAAPAATAHPAPRFHQEETSSATPCCRDRRRCIRLATRLSHLCLDRFEPSQVISSGCRCRRTRAGLKAHRSAPSHCRRQQRTPRAPAGNPFAETKKVSCTSPTPERPTLFCYERHAA